MDEVIFRSSQRIENFQVQLGLAASTSKDILKQYSTQSKSLVIQAWNSSSVVQFRQTVKDFCHYVLDMTSELEYKVLYYADPRKFFYRVVGVFSKNWTKRDVYFLCAGFVCGSLVGISVGVIIRKKEPILRYMQAIQCLNYLGIESATVVEDAFAPYECKPDEILVNVKAASVHIIDAQICCGYGQTLRKILHRIYYSNKDLPLTLGRDCTGIITDIGSNVKRLEIGDEVWLTVPFWSQGTLSQSVLVPEDRVGRKPKTIGFEGACSLPYAGCLALSALQQVGLNSQNAQQKRILIQGGCTPVGCILTQILRDWGGNVTTTCYKRAVPVAKALGATDVIILPELVINQNDKSALNLENTSPILPKTLPKNLENTSPILPKTLPKELELRDRYDVIINTKDYGLSEKELQSFVDPTNGIVISTTSQMLSSDSYNFISRFFLGSYIRLMFWLEKLTGTTLNEYDETHLCYVALDDLAEMVESGILQTVVDKVFHPQDIEIALNHIQSSDSIGSTVITFR